MLANNSAHEDILPSSITLYIFKFPWTLLFLLLLICLEFASNLRNKTHKQWSHHLALWWGKDQSSWLRSGSCFSLSCCVKSLWKPCKKYLQFIWPQNEATEQIFHFVTLKLSLIVSILGILTSVKEEITPPPSTVYHTSHIVCWMKKGKFPGVQKDDIDCFSSQGKVLLKCIYSQIWRSSLLGWMDWTGTSILSL